MVPVSVVIITKNVSNIVKGCIEKVCEITDDVIIIYNGDEEDTSATALHPACRVYHKTWEGYSVNKNKGIDAAFYNWILSIDSDEIPDNELINSLSNINFDDADAVYDIKFRSYFGGKLIRYGSWGRDHHIRLFNRKHVKWSEAMVHETLELPSYIQKRKLEGHIHHYSVKDAAEFDSKNSYYAKLSAKKYFRSEKKAGMIKLYFSPIFGFLKNYIFFLGFLDGREGWNIAKTTIRSTRRKYHFLSQMENRPDKGQPVKDSLVVEY